MKPWDVVSTDVLQLPTTTNLNKYVLIFVDNFSRYIEAKPLPGINGETVSNTLVQQIICRHGCPTTLICDNASYYVHGEFERVYKFLGIKMAPSTAYHPEANGIAESKVKALKTLLRSLAKQDKYNWDCKLPYAVFAFNTSFNKTTGFTPFWINHGFEANLPGQIPMTLVAADSNNETRVSQTSYCADLFFNIHQAFQLVEQNLTQANLQHTNIQDIPHTFQLDDEVFYFSPVKKVNDPISFKQFWIGPYKILQQISPVIVKIQHIDDPSNTKTVHISKLKKRFLS